MLACENTMLEAPHSVGDAVLLGALAASALPSLLPDRYVPFGSRLMGLGVGGFLGWAAGSMLDYQATASMLHLACLAAVAALFVVVELDQRPRPTQPAAGEEVTTREPGAALRGEELACSPAPTSWKRAAPSLGAPRSSVPSRPEMRPRSESPSPVLLSTSSVVASLEPSRGRSPSSSARSSVSPRDRSSVSSSGPR